MRIQKIFLILLPFVIILLMATPFYLKSSLSAPKTVAATPKEALQTMVAAMQNQDVDKMIGIVRDDDYIGDFAFQRTDYEEQMRRESVVSFNILSEKQLDANTVEMLTEIKFSGDSASCPRPPMPMKIIRDETSDSPSWKVWLENWTLDCNPQSATFGQLSRDLGTRGPTSIWEQSKHLFKATLGIK